MNYRKRIEELGLKKKFVAESMGINVSLFSQYINEIKPIPAKLENELKKYLNKFVA